MGNTLKCAFGPTLYRIHHNLPLSELGRNYLPNAVEENTDKILGIISTVKNVLYYTVPVWSVMLYRRGYFTIAYGTDLMKYSLWFACIYYGLLFIRGFGRSNNQEYVDFLSVLENSKVSGADPTKKRMYDFTFSHWPVDFRWDEGVEVKKTLVTPPYHITGRLRKISQNNSIASLLIKGLPCEFLSYLISHGFGLSMVYPGSTAILNSIIRTALDDGRNKMVENSKGKRAKLLSRDGNHIDTMFVDRRQEEDDSPSVSARLGDILVIGCEGNAGFYEVGVMITPLEVGYSVLGWNHPGFGCSTGSPSPAAEINAIDVVMQYAITKLGFQPENIILFGWSIGAFSALNGAVLYPDVRSVFLDATFDDIVPLAVKAMPPAFENIVKNTIRSYINLHHSDLLQKYNGPVHFVRRQMDEVMNKEGQRVVSSNCGNALLYKFLKYRFPVLFGKNEEDNYQIKAALDSWLDRDDDVMRMSLMSSYEVIDQRCESMLRSYVEKHSSDYPIMIGEDLSLEAKQRLVLYLAAKHMSHFESSHCPPLPGAMFIKPWNVVEDIIQGSCDSKESSGCDSSDDFEIINGQNKL
ncbi:phosphatidylserine lipase ABHD16A-like [Styela clava]